MLENSEVSTVPMSNMYRMLYFVFLNMKPYMKNDTTTIITRSIAKAMLLLVISTLPVPTIKTSATCVRVYSEFIPNRQGVTMRLEIIVWNTIDAAPMANAAINMAISLGTRIFIEYCT